MARLLTQVKRQSDCSDQNAVTKSAKHHVLGIGRGVEPALPPRKRLYLTLGHAGGEGIGVLGVGLQHQGTVLGGVIRLQTGCYTNGHVVLPLLNVDWVESYL